MIKKKNTTIGRGTDHISNSKSDDSCSETSLCYMVVELHEFGLQELKICEMEAEVSPVYLTFKERERILETEK